MSACDLNFSGIAHFGDFDKRKPENPQKGAKPQILAFAYTYLFWVLSQGPKYAF